MFDWIPIYSYSTVYYVLIMVVTLFTALQLQAKPLESLSNQRFIKGMGNFLLIFLLLYMGLRPVHGVFVDMPIYARMFQNYKAGSPITSLKDPVFHSFTYSLAPFVSVRAYFFILTALYIFPLWIVSKKWFGDYAALAFLLLVGSFSFWPYGVNGIRNGIATSLFLLAISREKWLWRGILLFVAVGFHKSMLIPVSAYFLAFFYKNPKTYLNFWLLCIPLSLVAGSFFQSIFSSLIEDDRTSYLSDVNPVTSTRFRWDFLIYGGSAVLAGWYYVFKKNYNDKLYLLLYSTFLISNAFWILVIRADFSNRFAYLSWFLMAIIIVYPPLKHRFMGGQNFYLATISFLYVSFTVFMYFLYYGSF